MGQLGRAIPEINIQSLRLFVKLGFEILQDLCTLHLHCGRDTAKRRTGWVAHWHIADEKLHRPKYVAIKVSFAPKKSKVEPVKSNSDCQS